MLRKTKARGMWMCRYREKGTRQFWKLVEFERGGTGDEVGGVAV